MVWRWSDQNLFALESLIGDLFSVESPITGNFGLESLITCDFGLESLIRGKFGSGSQPGTGGTGGSVALGATQVCLRAGLGRAPPPECIE